LSNATRNVTSTSRAAALLSSALRVEFARGGVMMPKPSWTLSAAVPVGVQAPPKSALPQPAETTREKESWT
jgi:hypothetical protein